MTDTLDIRDDFMPARQRGSAFMRLALSNELGLAVLIAIAFGAFAAMMHLPIDQRPITERRAAASAAA